MHSYWVSQLYRNHIPVWIHNEPSSSTTPSRTYGGGGAFHETLRLFSWPPSHHGAHGAHIHQTLRQLRLPAPPLTCACVHAPGLSPSHASHAEDLIDHTCISHQQRVGIIEERIINYKCRHLAVRSSYFLVMRVPRK